MNLRTSIFLMFLFFAIGLVLGWSKREPLKSIPPAVLIEKDTVIQWDTIVAVKCDTIVVNKVRYFKKTDTVIVSVAPDTIKSTTLNCFTFPLLLSDSSKIEVDGCTKDILPEDLVVSAKYLDKRERLRVIEKTRVDTIRLRPNRLGFALGPSAGVGISINDISRPVYFIGATLTWGWRF